MCGRPVASLCRLMDASDAELLCRRRLLVEVPRAMCSAHLQVALRESEGRAFPDPFVPTRPYRRPWFGSGAAAAAAEAEARRRRWRRQRGGGGDGGAAAGMATRRSPR